MSKKTKQTIKSETEFNFEADVSKLLDIVANALYSQRDVFLRELIANASDACDKRRYLGLTDKSISMDNDAYGIRIHVQPDEKKLAITDNGIGMDRAELVDNLGVIARSGTAAFMQSAKDNMADLIGQFGVGFYSVFMVADRVEVFSRKAGTDTAFKWDSDGRTGFRVSEAAEAETGTSIHIYLKDDASEFLDYDRVLQAVRHYSDHIDVPITVIHGDTHETANVGTALWARPKNELNLEDYHRFYAHIQAGYDIPQHVVHWHAEGVIDYTALLYIPSMRPIDLFDPAQKHGVKLYIKRVFITDRCDGLVPVWLRFLRGIIDSRDLPLNISREMLQHNAKGQPIIQKIRAGIAKKILTEIENFREDESQFTPFWKNFGPVLKEGLYELGDHRDRILGMAIFHSLLSDESVTFKDYCAAMKDGQTHIYVMTGRDLKTMRDAPQLEIFKKKNIDVLLMTDTIDEFWVPILGQYGGHEFRSVTKDQIDLSFMPDTNQSSDHGVKGAWSGLLTGWKETLKHAVKDVRLTNRLTDSAVCLVADRGDADLNLEKIMKGRQGFINPTLRILEINPDHPLMQSILQRYTANPQDEITTECAWFLLDQARLFEGETPTDTQRFIQLMNQMMQKNLAH